MDLMVTETFLLRMLEFANVQGTEQRVSVFYNQQTFMG